MSSGSMAGSRTGGFIRPVWQARQFPENPIYARNSVIDLVFAEELSQFKSLKLRQIVATIPL